MDHLASIAAHLGVNAQESFRHFLSENEVNRLDQGRAQAALSLFDPRQLLALLHPSWLREKVAQLPVNQRKLFEKIEGAIYTSGATPECLRVLLLNQIFSSPENLEIPERKNAESSRLSVLFGTSSELLELIFQCIGCHFLAMNLRHVIAKKDLDHIIKALHPRTKRYLRKLMFASKKMEVAPLGVNIVSCSSEELQSILEQQGRLVFQQLLKTAGHDFSWYFLRQFDVEFAHTLLTTESSQTQVTIEKWVDTVCDIKQYLEGKE